MKYNGKRLLVLGGGASGISACRVLRNLQADVSLIEDTRKIDTDINFVSGFDECIISPGISSNDNIYKLCKLCGVPVISELEFGYRLNNSRLIAITGTNGKTTTVSLISQILNNFGKINEPLGNIGTPFCLRALDYNSNDILPLEVSSFQLENIYDFHANIAGILNITPDHFDRHKTFENYQELKMKIFANQTAKDYAILNIDQPEILGKFNSVSQMRFISIKQKVWGAYCVGGRIYIDDKFVMYSSNLKLIGTHNIYNALMAGLSTYLAGVDIGTIRRTLQNFTGVKHRLQNIGQIDDITFINDSKATNTDASIRAINCMHLPTVLILGGSDKGLSFGDLFAQINSKIKHIVICGAVRERMINQGCEYELSHKIIIADNFADAVKKSFELAKKLKKPCNILLSPACASFDEFVNYEARGEKFIEIFKSLAMKKN